MDEKIIRIQKRPEEWRESYHYGLYNHGLITKDGLTYTRSFIVIRNNFGVVVHFTNLHNYACIYENKVFVPITSDAEARLHYICMMLNYVLIKHYDRFCVDHVFKVSREALECFFRDYAQEKLPSGKYRGEQSIEKCVRAVTAFFRKLHQKFGNYVLLKNEDLFTETTVYNKYGKPKKKKLPAFQVRGITKNSEPFRELPTKAFRILLNLAFRYAPDIAFAIWNKWLVTRPLQIDANKRIEMNQYVAAMKLIGDVDLSEYPDLRKQFNRLQKDMTKILPCWAVTSLSAKGRIPFQSGIFDLVVIDEASQCDIASVLPLLYRARRAVIIGDPKQLSHISSISKSQDLSLLQKYGVGFEWSYSANSLYALASGMADSNEIVQLRDHHRSYGEIIEFSNAEFYGGKLRIATNYDKLKCPNNAVAGIRWVDVGGHTVRPTSGGAYNNEEVMEILKELKRLIISNNYKGSVGVVTPFRAQADRIRDAIEKSPDIKKYLYNNNDFLVDTVHKFQGDERDVMIFSPVISVGTSPGALGFLKNTGNLFNVAITRARAILVVIGDMNYCAGCGVPYIEHFVEYVRRHDEHATKEAITPQIQALGRDYPKVSNAEQVSDWERFFYSALFDADIITIPQYPVDKYKLDLALINGERRLDIEVDGEMYHKDWNGELCYRDQLRNQRLFEIGWDVKRFWVYQIRDELPWCIEQVRKWLTNS